MLRVISPEVDIELAVGEPIADPVCPVHGQRGLADATGTRDRRDHHGRRLGVAGVQQRVELGELGGAPGEPVHVERELAGHDGHRGGSFVGGELRDGVFPPLFPLFEIATADTGVRQGDRQRRQCATRGCGRQR
jgi:hypothetical protein